MSGGFEPPTHCRPLNLLLWSPLLVTLASLEGVRFSSALKPNYSFATPHTPLPTPHVS